MEKTPTAGQKKLRKTVAEMAIARRKAEEERGKMRVNIGKAFERWKVERTAAAENERDGGPISTGQVR